jgi:hypothetical protein
MLGSIRFPLTSLGVLTTVLLLQASSPRAQGEEEIDFDFDRTPKKCITTSRIRDTDIIDDRTIVFRMRGNREVYRNYLPRECPGLERNDRFSHRTMNGQLCDIDTITVLEQFAGRINESFTCRLGEFIPITREEAEELELEKEGQGGRRRAISSEPVELPDGAEDEQDAEDGSADSAGEAPDAPSR